MHTHFSQLQQGMDKHVEQSLQGMQLGTAEKRALHATHTKSWMMAHKAQRKSKLDLLIAQALTSVCRGSDG